MYKKPRYNRSQIKCETTLEGETIEEKVDRLMRNKEPIDDGSPVIYTDRKEGVNPAYNIRTDRFEIATDIMDKVHRDKVAKTDGTNEPVEPEGKVINLKDGKPESTAGTANK